MGWGLEYCKFARWMAHSAVRRANYGERRRWWLFESTWRYHYSGYPARMAELADAMDSKSIVRKGVWVQVPLRARVFRSASAERLRRNFRRSQIRLTRRNRTFASLGVLCGFSDLQAPSGSAAIFGARRSDCLRRNRSFVAALLWLLCGFSVGPRKFARLMANCAVQRANLGEMTADPGRRSGTNLTGRPTLLA